jgi:hypothetical protein
MGASGLAAGGLGAGADWELVPHFCPLLAEVGLLTLFFAFALDLPTLKL